jgi:hypothetical protein
MIRGRPGAHRGGTCPGGRTSGCRGERSAEDGRRPRRWRLSRFRRRARATADAGRPVTGRRTGYGQVRTNLAHHPPPDSFHANQLIHGAKGSPRSVGHDGAGLRWSDSWQERQQLQGSGVQVDHAFQIAGSRAGRHRARQQCPAQEQGSAHLKQTTKHRAMIAPATGAKIKGAKRVMPSHAASSARRYRRLPPGSAGELLDLGRQATRRISSSPSNRCPDRTRLVSR